MFALCKITKPIYLHFTQKMFENVYALCVFPFKMFKFLKINIVYLKRNKYQYGFDLHLLNIVMSTLTFYIFGLDKIF